MAVRLGDEAPNFTADTTEGRITFHAWKGKSWAVLALLPLVVGGVVTPTADAAVPQASVTAVAGHSFYNFGRASFVNWNVSRRRPSRGRRVTRSSRTASAVCA